jgi:homoserine O-acetyltransferase
LLTEGLGLKHVRMILGNSMGGMHTWVWGITHPDFMDVLVPMASTPNQMSGRNWMMRRFIIDSIRQDPAWMNGQYTTQPPSLQFANVFFATATSGGDQGLYRKAPTREQADRLLDQSLKASSTADANNHLYLWEASRDYNPNPHLEKIKATVLAVNSADDERNPPSLGLMEKALQRMPTARLFLIPGSEQTSGHGTTGQAKWWKEAVSSVLATAPVRGK